MDNGTQTILMIERISQGGYLVTKWEGGSMPRDLMIATTTIDEALKFIRDKMLPIQPSGPVNYKSALNQQAEDWMRLP